MPSADASSPSPAAPAEAAVPPVTVHGDATPEQLAALVAVLSAVSGAAGDGATAGRPRWADHGRSVRGSSMHGPGAWRASVQPR